LLLDAFNDDALVEYSTNETREVMSSGPCVAP
jgi:hypothetical protein